MPVGTTTTHGTPGTCTQGCLPANLQPLAEVVPVVLQDRMFDTNGQLFFPSDSAGGVLASLNPEHPYWVPEFVGDTIVVNGKAWPFFNVEPKRYRFLFLNGSNARTYEMNIIDPLKVATPPNMWVISTDGGYLDAPALAKKLVMQPGERYGVIIDFSGVAPGTNLVIKNTGKTPYPAGASPQGATTGQIMQFRVGPCASQCGPQDTSYNPALGTPLRAGSNAIVRLVNPATGVMNVPVAKTRQLTLNEVMGMPQTVIDPVTGALTAYPGGPLEILVNNTLWSGNEHGATPRPDFTGVTVNGVTTYYSELPQEGDTEIWEIVNLTADAHPIHLHLVQFQLISRQNFNTNTYNAAYNAAFGTGPTPLPTGCAAGVFCPAYGPPLAYNPSASSGGKYGGNPDVGLLGKNGKPVYMQGKPMPPDPNEAGWKDTVITYPGQVTRIAVRWAPTYLSANAPSASLHYPFDPNAGSQFNYVWHCHIIDHEDNEMMRPDVVMLNPAAPTPANRLLREGFDY
jgi:spore coat protein A